MNRMHCSGLRGALLGAAAVIALAALPAAAGAAAASTDAQPAKEVMVRRMAQHVDEHLDALAERLEIKASQQQAWQAFAAAFREVMTPPAAPAAGTSGKERDAASMAREHADRAAAHAQQLGRLADATAKLQQALGADQRAVLNEAARHFAREHLGHGGMMHPMGSWHAPDGPWGRPGGWGMSDHCDEHPGHGPLGYGAMGPQHGPGMMPGMDHEPEDAPADAKDAK